MEEWADSLAGQLYLLDCYLGWCSGAQSCMLLAGIQIQYRHPDTTEAQRQILYALGEFLRAKFKGMPKFYEVLAIGWDRPVDLMYEMAKGC